MSEESPAAKLVNMVLLEAVKRQAKRLRIAGGIVHLDDAEFMQFPPKMMENVFRRVCVMTDTIPPYGFPGQKQGRITLTIGPRTWNLQITADHGQQIINIEEKPA